MEYSIQDDPLGPPLGEFIEWHNLLLNIPLEPLHEDWFRRRAWVRSIHGTTHIEGNTLNDEEVEDVLSMGVAGYPRREALEVLGTREAFRLVDELALDPSLRASEQLVREVHRRVLDEIDPFLRPGDYRRGENRVTDGQGRLIFRTPPSGDVPDLMHRFGHWMQDGCDGHTPPVASALAHLELVAIHPFYDGNGRTSRALVRFILRHGGYSFRDMASVDAELDRDRAEYFAAIRASAGRVYRRGYDATAFVVYFLRVLTRAAAFVIRRLHAFHAVLSAVKGEARAGRLPYYNVDALGFVWLNRSIRPGQFGEITGRSPQRVSGDLRRLVEYGYLDPARGQTRRRLHMIGPTLEELGQSALKQAETRWPLPH